MSKKRPRGHGSQPRAGGSKWDVNYWRGRLFKNSYTVKGRRFEARAWSIKLQHRGRRKTFSLQAGNPAEAAEEACSIYQTVVTQGWTAPRGVASHGTRGGATSQQRLAPRFWEQRLIHREYPSQLIPRSQSELSVRIDHESGSWYFPLGTNVREDAARRALEIYRQVAFKGWDAALRENCRELTVAFHWSNNPLAWTYTTMHTETNALEWSGAGKRRVVIVEPDAGTRIALANCVSRMSGFTCAGAYAGAKEALDHVRERSVDLVLIGQNVAGKPGTLYLDELRSVAPGVWGLIYSAYVDSEELFRTTPGGAGYYLLKRVSATEFLDPLSEMFARGEKGSITEACSNYFMNTVLSSPITGSPRELTNLTQREHEVLALLSKGHQDKAIASRLGISIYTVHVHVRNIFEKLGVHNRIGAVVKYFQK